MVMQSKKVSLYTQGGERAANCYYRFLQYFNKLNISLRHNKQLPDYLYLRCMPISEQPILFKLFIALFIIIRVTYALCVDVLFPPKYLVISKTLVKKFMPYYFNILLLLIKKRGTIIIWDFDDNILSCNDISAYNFDFLSNLSSKIVIASEELQRNIASKYSNKVLNIPTTDGDMFHLFSNELIEQKSRTLGDKVKLVWCATSSSLSFLNAIIPYIDELPLILNREVELTVVCNKPLNVTPKHIKIRNVLWEREIAIKEMLSAHIGLMPLQDNEFNRGKGGFKLIQYLSIGLPVVGSAVGINRSIIKENVGSCIYELESNEWRDGILRLVSDRNKWMEYCLNSYNRWISDYSYNSNLEEWNNILK